MRPVRMSDKDQLLIFSKTTSPGIANLSAIPRTVEKKIQKSIASFQKKVLTPEKEQYMFMLEDTSTRELVGTSSIKSNVGALNTYCTYYIENAPLGELDGLLYPRIYEDGPSELCALYLDANFRKHGLGKLLSLSRFLFIASHKERFSETLLADMRGYITQEGKSPFWSATGEKLTKYNFLEVLKKLDAEELTMIDLIANTPLHVAMLPIDVQNSLGRVHPKTEPALKMLIDEGLRFNHEISVLDGGPVIYAPTNTLVSITHSYSYPVIDIHQPSADEFKNVIISNEKIDFRATIAHAQITPDGVKLDAATAQALNVHKDETVRLRVLG